MTTTERPRRGRGTAIGEGITWAARWSLRLALVALGITLIGWIVGQLWSIALPVIMAVIVATVLWPPTAWLRKHRFPPALAAATVLLAGIVVLAGVVALISTSVSGSIPQISASASTGVQAIQQWLSGPPLNLAQGQLDAALQTATQQLQASISSITTSVLTGVGSVASGVVTALITLVLAFLFVKDGPRFLPWLRKVAGEGAGGHVAEVLRRIWKTLTDFIRVQAIVALVDGVLIGIGLVVLGVPLAIPLAVLTFLGGFVPIVGAFVAGALSVLVALVSNGFTTALIVLAIIVAVQQLEGNILQPILQGRSLNLHAAVVLLAITAGSTLWGIAGAFLAVPVASAAAIVMRYLGERIATGSRAMRPRTARRSRSRPPTWWARPTPRSPAPRRSRAPTPPPRETARRPRVPTAGENGPPVRVGALTWADHLLRGRVAGAAGSSAPEEERDESSGGRFRRHRPDRSAVPGCAPTDRAAHADASWVGEPWPEPPPRSRGRRRAPWLLLLGLVVLGLVLWGFARHGSAGSAEPRWPASGTSGHGSPNGHPNGAPAGALSTAGGAPILPLAGAAGPGGELTALSGADVTGTSLQVLSAPTRPGSGSGTATPTGSGWRWRRPTGCRPRSAPVTSWTSRVSSSGTAPTSPRSTGSTPPRARPAHPAGRARPGAAGPDPPGRRAVTLTTEVPFELADDLEPVEMPEPVGRAGWRPVRVYLGSDHAGFDLKAHLIAQLTGLGHEAVDVGPATYDAADDYPPFCIEAARRTLADPDGLGVVIGGSGNGEQMAANKVPGIRCALAWSTETATLARQHNNAQVVAVGARMHTAEDATEIVLAFVGTPFSGEPRHERRIEQLAEYERTGVPPVLPPDQVPGA
ncbi:ribose-5-phosphate isomerase [Pseudonocardia sp. CNS-139]|nr:ribose-5-phosphate isomerase [Pseudonocardia sp. CNS-139]